MIFASKKMALFQRLTIIVIVSLLSSTVLATEIVVNRDVPEASYSVSDIRAIFAMQKRVWSNNRQIKVYTLSDNHPVHKDFVKHILHMLPYQIRIIWDRLIYSGSGVAPIELQTEMEMLDKIATTPDSIGYLNNKVNNKNVRALTYEQ